MTISFSLSVEKIGMAKLVLITPGDEVIVLYENADNTVTDSMQTALVTVAKGDYRIKIVDMTVLSWTWLFALAQVALSNRAALIRNQSKQMDGYLIS